MNYRKIRIPQLILFGTQVWTSDLKNCANSRPSASNFKKTRTIFLTVRRSEQLSRQNTIENKNHLIHVFKNHFFEKLFQVHQNELSIEKLRPYFCNYDEITSTFLPQGPIANSME